MVPKTRLRYFNLKCPSVDYAWHRELQKIIPINLHITILLEKSVCLEMNLRKRKWLVADIYKPPQSCGKTFTERFSNGFNDLRRRYDNILLLGDFNMTPENLTFNF